jgi:superfamily II DNA or RNA helicase
MKLRDYQVTIDTAINKFMASSVQRAQVYSPTGSGKTVNYFATIRKHMTRGTLKVCIMHPRIALSQEQQGRFKNEFGTLFHTTCFHSGAVVKGEEKIQEISTTDPEDIKRFHESFPLDITFSSYDSFFRLLDIEFDLLIVDEAHNFTQEQYRKLLPFIKAKKVLFFTATPVTDEVEEQKLGMDNPELFGEVIASVEPSGLIRDGWIVGPIVHRLNVTTNQKGDGVNTHQIVADAFKYQTLEMQKCGVAFTKMLVTSRGYGDHKNVEDNLVVMWEMIGKQVDTYVIEAASARKNGRPLTSRMAAINEIRSSSNDVIVLHYDTLAEGIDVDSLTGALILRAMSQAKLLQTIGRCGRPLLNKKYSVITLPIVDGTHIGGLQADTIVGAFINGGYDQLTMKDDLSGKEIKIVATKEDPLFDFGEDDIDPAFSDITNCVLQRRLDDLKKQGILVF